MAAGAAALVVSHLGAADGNYYKGTQVGVIHLEAQVGNDTESDKLRERSTASTTRARRWV